MGQIICGDAVGEMRKMDEASIYAIVTDPPYLLSFMGKEWDTERTGASVSDLVFRSWLAGFIAGEGYFRIHKEKNGDYYACNFGVHMRADEGPILRGLAKKTGAGTVTISAGDGHINPMARWVVQSKEDCWRIARLLDGVPFHAKKQREYDLWRRALDVWTKTKKGNRWHGPRDNSSMRELYDEMKKLRPYDSELAESNFDPFGQPSYDFHYRWAIEALRVAKPGAHLLAFGGTRTFHRLVCAIEDAGWEIRDTIAWVYGSGFPKSHNLTEEWNGWGTSLKPAFEPITIARKPLIGTVEKNVLKYGTGALNIDECRMDGIPPSVPQPSFNSPSGKIYGFKCGEGRNGEMSQSTKGRWPANLIHDGSDEVLWLFPETGHGNFPPKRGDGHIFGRSYGTNQPERKTDSGSAARFFYCAKASRREREAGLESLPAVTYARSGGAQGAERRGEDEYFQNSIGLNRISKVKNNHPTVKPLALMRYLCRLVTPPGGTILDPFAGSGTTGIAATLEGFNFVLIEKEPDYVRIAEKRIEFFSRNRTGTAGRE